jgi:hypothetical protein
MSEPKTQDAPAVELRPLSNSGYSRAGVRWEAGWQPVPEALLRDKAKMDILAHDKNLELKVNGVVAFHAGQPRNGAQHSEASASEQGPQTPLERKLTEDNAQLHQELAAYARHNSELQQQLNAVLAKPPSLSFTQGQPGEMTRGSTTEQPQASSTPPATTDGTSTFPATAPSGMPEHAAPSPTPGAPATPVLPTDDAKAKPKAK